MTVPARAKINLSLVVQGRRPDGYHEVLTLLHTISLADSVTITLAADGRRPGAIEVACRPCPELDGAANLAYKAAAAYLDAVTELLQAAGSVVPAVRISIEKRIPVAAGLAGGSSDAAATLRGLHELLSPQLRRPDPLPCRSGSPPCPPDLIARVAAALGADVPFCLSGGAAWGVGRGDTLKPVSSVLDGPVLIAVPPFGVSSRDAYAWWDEDHPSCGAAGPAAWSTPGRVSPGMPPCAGPPGPPGLPGRLDSIEQVVSLVRNDLRPPVARRHAVIGGILRTLSELGARSAEMSGSGPAAYGLFETENRAREAGERLTTAFPGVRVLHARLDPVTAPPLCG